MSYGFDSYGGEVPEGAREPGLYAQEMAQASATSSTSVSSPIPAATAFQANMQSFTPEQLAQTESNDPNTLGKFDLAAWFNANRAAFDPNNTMGDLSQTLAGRAVATGYIDENGRFVGTPFAGAGQAYQLSQLAQTGPQGQQAGQMNNIASSQAYQGLSGLLEQMRNYQPMTAEQRATYGEQMTGMGAGSLQNLNQQLQGGIGGVQGMSDQEKTLYQRQIQQQIDSTRQENREIMGALSGSGRSIAAYDAMETAASQIADFTIQSQLELINNDWAKKQLEYQALKDQRDMIVQSGMQGSEQYEQQLNQMWNQTITGYAQQISALANQNTQYLQQFNDHAQALYNSMISDIGLTEAAMNQSSELWAQAHMDELLAQSEAIITDLLKD